MGRLPEVSDGRWVLLNFPLMKLLRKSLGPATKVAMKRGGGPHFEAKPPCSAMFVFKQHLDGFHATPIYKLPPHL